MGTPERRPVNRRLQCDSVERHNDRLARVRLSVGVTGVEEKLEECHLLVPVERVTEFVPGRFYRVELRPYGPQEGAGG